MLSLNDYGIVGERTADIDPKLASCIHHGTNLIDPFPAERTMLAAVGIQCTDAYWGVTQSPTTTYLPAVSHILYKAYTQKHTSAGIAIRWLSALVLWRWVSPLPLV